MPPSAPGLRAGKPRHGQERRPLGPKQPPFRGAVVGGLPQHVHLPESVGDLVVGSGNTIRENVTIHRAMQPGNFTEVGDHCLLMCNSHVAHDCRIGDHVVLTNNVMLAGHVTVGERAFFSGGAGIHQFCRVGTLAMVGGRPTSPATCRRS